MHITKRVFKRKIEFIKTLTDDQTKNKVSGVEFSFYYNQYIKALSTTDNSKILITSNKVVCLHRAKGANMT